MADARAWGRATALGAVRHAERLGSAVVDTEHLLMAALSDPVVRWAFRTSGVDLRDVRTEVVRATSKRPTGRHPGELSADAADAVMKLGAEGEALDGAHPSGVEVARALQALTRRFLCRTKRTAARDILDRLGLIRQSTRLLANIGHNGDHAGPTP